MSQCVFSSVLAISFICELNDGFEHDHQLNAVHDFNLLFI